MTSLGGHTRTRSTGVLPSVSTPHGATIGDGTEFWLAGVPSATLLPRV